MTPNLMSVHALTPSMPLPETGIVGMPIGKSAFEKNSRRQNFDFFKCFFDSSNDHRVVIFKVFGATARTGGIDAGRRVDFHRLLAAELVDSDRRRF